MHEPKAILVVLDGWGHCPVKEGNAIAQASKPNFDRLWKEYPHTLLGASGEAVGLPWGELGSSEVGHLTIGSGQVTYQDLLRVTRAIQDRTFFDNPSLLSTLEWARKNHSSLHLIGLVSAGGVHSHIDHLKALLTLLKKHKFSQPCYIHMFTDGRDTAPKSAALYLKKLQEHIDSLHLPIYVASMTGRYFAMDRDNHWDRTLSAYENLVSGKGIIAQSPQEAINTAYKREETDEFIRPTTILTTPYTSLLTRLKLGRSSTKPQPSGIIKDNDAIVFFNFRPERMRQLVELFLFPRPDMPDKSLLKNLSVVTLTEYAQYLPVSIAFPPDHITNPLAKIISDHNLAQLHVSETEKYAHVTYFFNGGNPEPYKGEQWHLVPSPKVATYDKKPEMSAAGITDYVIDALDKNQYDFVLINYANADLVGHTGNLKAAIKGVETIDKQLGRLIDAFPNTYLFVTADHGNAEKMVNPQSGDIDKEHSLNPVPFIAVSKSLRLSRPQPSIEEPTGILADITPTILNVLNIPALPEMTGYNLLESLAPSPKQINTKSPARLSPIAKS